MFALQNLVFNHSLELIRLLRLHFAFTVPCNLVTLLRALVYDRLVVDLIHSAFYFHAPLLFFLRSHLNVFRVLGCLVPPLAMGSLGHLGPPPSVVALSLGRGGSTCESNVEMVSAPAFIVPVLYQGDYRINFLLLGSRSLVRGLEVLTPLGIHLRTLSCPYRRGMT